MAHDPEAPNVDRWEGRLSGLEDAAAFLRALEGKHAARLADNPDARGVLAELRQWFLVAIDEVRTEARMMGRGT